MERVFLAAGPWSRQDPQLGAVAREAGSQCLTVPSARDAALELAQSEPDALVVHTALDGVEALLLGVRTNPAFERLPIVAVIAEPTDREAIHAFTLGADDFVLEAELEAQLAAKLAAALAEVEAAITLPASRTVLLADASQLHQRVMGKLLTQAGFVVTAVS